MSFARQYVAQTRTRLLSTDQNTQSDLATFNTDRAVGLSAVGTQPQDFSAIGGSSRYSGVVSGLVVSTAAGLSVNISEGLGYKQVVPAGQFDSDLGRVELLADAQLDLAPAQDASFPVWVAIEIAPGVASEIQTVQDVFNPVNGTFSAALLDLVVAPSPTISFNAGTPAASPALPAGTPGTIPLAYVLLPASPAAAIPADNIHLCRPMLGDTRESRFLAAARWGQGAGVSKNDAIDDLIMPSAARGQYRDGSFWQMDGATDYSLAGSTLWNLGESLAAFQAGIPLGEAGSAYVFACKPPFPGGYDADVNRTPRELVVPVGGSAIPSAPQGSSGTVLIVTGTAPTSGQSAIAPVAAGALTSQDPAFAGGSVDAQDCVYLGAFTYNGNSGGFFTQKAQGGVVQFTGDAFPLAVLTPPQVNAPIEPRTIQGGSSTSLPAFVERFTLEVDYQKAGTVNVGTFQIDDDTGRVAAYSDGSTSGLLIDLSSRDDAYVDPSSNLVVGLSNLDNVGTLTIGVFSYEDPYLIRR